MLSIWLNVDCACGIATSVDFTCAGSVVWCCSGGFIWCKIGLMIGLIIGFNGWGIGIGKKFAGGIIGGCWNGFAIGWIETTGGLAGGGMWNCLDILLKSCPMWWKNALL